MLTRVMWAAILSGIAAGMLLSAFQAWKVLPLIAQAETYEIASAGTDGEAAAPSDGHDHDHGEGWSPEDGWERLGWTIVTNLLIGSGFALLMAGVAVLTGLPLTLQNGWIWGLLAFLSLSLSPALGLPPELPGMQAGDLVGRQIWWFAAAILAVLGIVLIALKQTPGFIAMGLVLMLLPHIVGAPASPLSTQVPAELAATHVSASLAVMVVFWIALGSLQGYLLQRFAAQGEEF